MINLKKLGTIQFRRSYTNHQMLSDNELDSLSKSNPEFNLIFKNSNPGLPEYMEKLGLSYKNELLIDQIDTLLQDSLTFPISSGKKYTITTGLINNSCQTFLYISDGNCKDSILFEEVPIHPNFRLLTYEPQKKKFILAYSKYYFMNGDMYDVALLEVP